MHCRQAAALRAISRLDLGWISARSGRQAAVLRAPRVSDEGVDGDHRLERGEAGLTKDQLSLKEKQPAPSLESAARVAFLASSLKDATTSACTSGLAASSFGSPSMPTPLAASTSAFSLTCASATYPTACLASSRAISADLRGVRERHRAVERVVGEAADAPRLHLDERRVVVGLTSARMAR